MFPYIDTTNWHVGRFAFAPMTALVAIALAGGYFICLHRLRSRGIEREFFTKLALWVLASAFVGGHLLRLVSEPGALAMVFTHPSLFINVLNGQASFGIFLGGFVAALVLLKWHKIPYRDWYLYADSVAFAVPLSCWLVRLGCYLVHDHPGIRTRSWLGVRYPGGTRYDLGLLEALFLLALALVFLLLDRKPAPRGFFFVTFLFCYGSFRILADRLHVQPVRYSGWTADQITGSLLILIAIATFFDQFRFRAV